MKISKAIEERRSIRKFTSQTVDRSILLSLIRAGALAPSASNAQFWRFIVADNQDLVRKLDLYCPGMSGKPTAIIVIASDLEEVASKGSKNSIEYGCMMDASMAAENIILQALEFGLGACVIKSYNDGAVRKLLGIPDTLRIEILISVGYPDGEPRERKRKDLDQILQWNGWNTSDTEGK